MIKTRTLLLMSAIIATASFSVHAQQKPSVAVIAIDAKGVAQNAESVAYIVRLELEKVNVFNVIDKYDAAEAVGKNNIDVNSCFGKNCVVAAGKILEADKMVTGSIEKFGDKIVISIKLIDVKSASVEKQNATEYLNVQNELQRMIAISVHKLLGLPVDQIVADQLVNYDTPVQSPRTKLSLNGPRMGFSMATGETARILRAPEGSGGYNMYPATFQFGWQQEWQYLSAGDFQALIEFLPMIGGLESGKIIPSITFLNGFRMGKGGWEFAFGPTFRIISKADGFIGDGRFGTEEGKWYRSAEWLALSHNPTAPDDNPYPLFSRIDSRGDLTLSTSLFFGFGKTFRSGYLNIPVNAYVIPHKDGTVVGASFGFNIYKKGKII
ncbi:MAG TPA: hypothetical protein VFE50_09015 [Cyclobacteriaceae bacterium]|nr:hypothetical protein [Cyclobacteriaceae bacterium]